VFIGIFVLSLFDVIVFLLIFVVPVILILVLGAGYKVVRVLLTPEAREAAQPLTLVAILIVGSAVVVLSYLTIIQANFIAPVEQAQYFDGLIKVKQTDFFVNEIENDRIRLVDPELAQAIVDRHAAVFGSNIKARSLHVTVNTTGHLVWVAAMAADNEFNQELAGLLIVDASNPSAIPEKITFSAGQATVSENLFFEAHTSRLSWTRNAWQKYGRTYITWVPENLSLPGMSPGDIVQVQTFNRPQLGRWVTEFGGVQVLNLNGNVLATYTSEIPKFASQPYDEEWLESNIANWGNLRQGDGFNLFAGGFLGFIQPSSDRVQISRDTRYILSPDTNEVVAVTPVHSSASDLSGAGVFVSDASGITFYDYRNRGYRSSIAIEQFVESNEPQVAQGEYYATLPMLYPVSFGNSTRMAWFTPVYYQTAQYDSDGNVYQYNVEFRGLYVLDAVQQTVYGKSYLEGGISSRNMVAAAKQGYRTAALNAGLISGEGQTNGSVDPYTTANITQKDSFVVNGTTQIVFKTNNTTFQYLLASPLVLSTTDWLYALLDVQVSVLVKFKAFQSGSTWVLTEIKPA